MKEKSTWCEAGTCAQCDAWSARERAGLDEALAVAAAYRKPWDEKDRQWAIVWHVFSCVACFAAGVLVALALGGRS